jgi:hypothetical protein
MRPTTLALRFGANRSPRPACWRLVRHDSVFLRAAVPRLRGALQIVNKPSNPALYSSLDALCLRDPDLTLKGQHTAARRSPPTWPPRPTRSGVPACTPNGLGRPPAPPSLHPVVGLPGHLVQSARACNSKSSQHTSHGAVMPWSDFAAGASWFRHRVYVRVTKHPRPLRSTVGHRIECSITVGPRQCSCKMRAASAGPKQPNVRTHALPPYTHMHTPACNMRAAGLRTCACVKCEGAARGFERSVASMAHGGGRPCLLLCTSGDRASDMPSMAASARDTVATLHAAADQRPTSDNSGKPRRLA